MNTFLPPQYKYGGKTHKNPSSNPEILIMSGMHGDEHEVDVLVAEYLERKNTVLPKYVYIPEVSPSAIALRTRNNVHKNDINRQFIASTDDPEAKGVMDFLKHTHFSLCINFHEDRDRWRNFYYYDSNTMPEVMIQRLQHKIRATGAGLFSGIDDEFDPKLGLNVVNGLVYTPKGFFKKEEGFVGVWLLEEGIVDRYLNPEVPGKADLPLKRKLVEAFFDFFLLDFPT